MPRAPLQVLYHPPFAKPIPYEKLSVSASILQESYQATLSASEALWELLTWHLWLYVLSWVCQGSWVYLFSKVLQASLRKKTWQYDFDMTYYNLSEWVNEWVTFSEIWYGNKQRETDWGTCPEVRWSKRASRWSCKTQKRIERKVLTLSIISDIIITELIEKQPIDAYVLELTNWQ